MVANKDESLEVQNAEDTTKVDTIGEEVANSEQQSTSLEQQNNDYSYEAGVQQINNMYDQSAEAIQAEYEQQWQKQRDEYQNTRDDVGKTYWEQQNDLANQYNVARRNMAMNDVANGLNTGTFYNRQESLSNVYYNNNAQLETAKSEQIAELDKAMADLDSEYQKQVNEALANNELERAQKLYDEWNSGYTKAMEKAQILGNYGDFSGYKDLGYSDEEIAAMVEEYNSSKEEVEAEKALERAQTLATYGDFSGYLRAGYTLEEVQKMQNAWISQNAQVAYMSGMITEDTYKAIIDGTLNGNFNVQGTYDLNEIAKEIKQEQQVTKVVTDVVNNSSELLTPVGDGNEQQLTPEQKRIAMDNVGTGVSAISSNMTEELAHGIMNNKGIEGWTTVNDTSAWYWNFNNNNTTSDSGKQSWLQKISAIGGVSNPTIIQGTGSGQSKNSTNISANTVRSSTGSTVKQVAEKQKSERTAAIERQNDSAIANGNQASPDLAAGIQNAQEARRENATDYEAEDAKINSIIKRANLGEQIEENIAKQEAYNAADNARTAAIPTYYDGSGEVAPRHIFSEEALNGTNGTEDEVYEAIVNGELSTPLGTKETNLDGWKPEQIEEQQAVNDRVYGRSGSNGRFGERLQFLYDTFVTGMPTTSAYSETIPTAYELLTNNQMTKEEAQQRMGEGRQRAADKNAQVREDYWNTVLQRDQIANNGMAQNGTPYGSYNATDVSNSEENTQEILNRMQAEKQQNNRDMASQATVTHGATEEQIDRDLGNTITASEREKAQAQAEAQKEAEQAREDYWNGVMQRDQLANNGMAQNGTPYGSYHPTEVTFTPQEEAIIAQEEQFLAAEEARAQFAAETQANFDRLNAANNWYAQNGYSQTPPENVSDDEVAIVYDAVTGAGMVSSGSSNTHTTGRGANSQSNHSSSTQQTEVTAYGPQYLFNNPNVSNPYAYSLPIAIGKGLSLGRNLASGKTAYYLPQISQEEMDSANALMEETYNNWVASNNTNGGGSW